MVVMEGPAFSTKAESFMYRSWGADIIGMTALPEAKLAREAEMCYTTMAWVTDYDCWRQGAETVTVEMVIQNQELDLLHLAFIDRNLQYSQIIFLHLNIWFILGYPNGEKE